VNCWFFRILTAGLSAVASPSPFPYGDHCCIAGIIDVEAVVACFLNREGEVRSIYLLDLPFEQLHHMQVQRPLIELELRGVIRNVSQCDAGFAVKASARSAHLQFGA